MTTEKKRPIRRLKTMYPLRAVVDGMYQRGHEAAQAGKPVAWCMVNWWQGDLILKAMDVATIYPEDYSAVCAAFGAAPDYLEQAEADGFPPYICGYARNCLGYAAKMTQGGGIPPGAPMGGMPRPTLLVASGSLCDARYKWFQALGRYLEAPLWMLELPHPGVKESLLPGAHQRNIGFIVKELKEFVAFLERLLGQKMDWDYLQEIIDDTIEMNHWWHKVNELRQARPCPMHSRDFWSSIPASLYVATDPREAARLYHNMYDEVKGRVDNKIGALESGEKYRLAFLELPPWHSLDFFNQLAERGWNFVIESWVYHPPRPLDLSHISDPLERIARYSYQWLTGYYPAANKAEEWWGYLAYPYLEYVRDYQCDGVVLHPLLTCRTGTSHLKLVADRLMQKLKVPSLTIEGDVVDLKLFDPVSALNKAETFEETMDHYKKLRKEAGFSW
ncbi:MAG: 2-hydroxyacyl-CoA dehydratase family protein [Dehalococcoidales bacterium]